MLQKLLKNIGKMRNTVQCSGSKVKPAGGDENDDHRLQDFFMPIVGKGNSPTACWSFPTCGRVATLRGERWVNFVCILANLHFVVLRFP